jgi:hypothetical protein
MWFYEYGASRGLDLGAVVVCNQNGDRVSSAYLNSTFTKGGKPWDLSRGS